MHRFREHRWNRSEWSAHIRDRRTTTVHEPLLGELHPAFITHLSVHFAVLVLCVQLQTDTPAIVAAIVTPSVRSICTYPITHPPASVMSSDPSSPSSHSASSSHHKHRPIPQLLHLKGTKKRLVIGMVGLPARGKTYIAKKLCRYLNWIGYNSAVFNIGSYRRKEVGSQIPATFFDPTNPQGVARRNELAQHALHDMFTFLGGTGQAAIYDGTNSTVERRKMVREYIKQKEKELDIQVQLVWIEMVCTDPSIVSENIREAKLTSPDSAGLPAEKAVENFVQRIKEYEKKYEELGSDPSEEEQSYMRNIDCGRRVINNHIEGYLMSKIAFFVMNLKINRAPIYITRHGESQHNVKGLIGGDPYLSPNGVKYAEALASFIASEKEITRDELEELSVWTSTLKRTLQTAEHLRPLNLPATHWRALIEIQVGSCDNMTYEEIEQKMPEEFLARKKDKLNYRYPQGGESYMDVIQRIEPCILELERMSTPVLLVVHRAVARCFYSYFLGQFEGLGETTSALWCPDNIGFLHSSLIFPLFSFRLASFRDPSP